MLYTKYTRGSFDDVTKGKTMNQRNNLKVLSEPIELIKERTKRYRRSRQRRLISNIVIAAIVIWGTYLNIQYQTYSDVSVISDYSDQQAAGSRYEIFGDKLIRYSRDGVAYLDSSITELWNQPGQISNPMLATSEKSFAIADVEGNSIMVFNEGGLRGEFETTLPIEKISVSNQGVVAAMLSSDTSPKIILFDAAGNELAEVQANIASTGYPLSIALSPDASVLMVNYATIGGSTIGGKVVCYNFGAAGQEKEDFIVTQDEYAETMLPVNYFVDSNTSVVIGDDGFWLYKGTNAPEKSREVKLDKAIKSTFHTERYIGFILKNTAEDGYELRLYNLRGSQVLSRNFVGEYSQVYMDGDEVIMLEGTRAFIVTTEGLEKFKGTLPVPVTQFIPRTGFNKYLLINDAGMEMVRLAK